MNHLKEAQETLAERYKKYGRSMSQDRIMLHALIAIAEELKKANELHSYFEEAMKEDKDVDAE